MRTVTQRIRIDRGSEDVFDLISDPVRYPEFFSGLTRWSLLGDRPGLGARYRVLMKVGSIEAGGVVVVTEWVRPQAIAWTAEQGIHQEGRWELHPASGATDTALQIAFDLSGGPVGKLVESIAGRIVARNMWASLLGARRLLEQDPPS